MSMQSMQQTVNSQEKSKCNLYFLYFDGNTHVQQNKTLKKVPVPYLSADRTRFPPETGVSGSTWSAEGAGVLGSVGSVLATVLDTVVVVVVAFSVVGWRIEDDVLIIIFSFSLYSDLAKTFLFSLQELFLKNDSNKQYHEKIATDKLPEMNPTFITLFFVIKHSC